ncbi:MAG: MBL fold metallo-hydrolase [Gammaproteobacteria bacterium]
MTQRFIAMILGFCLVGCAQTPPPVGPYLLVLGVAQDAGYPQPGCYSDRCERGWRDPRRRRPPVALGLVQPAFDSKALFEATPAIGEQLHALNTVAPDQRYSLDGIFLTHAHIGHYAGLMYLGREAIGSTAVPVFAMPRMTQFLQSNGPWDQLIQLNNVALQPLEHERAVSLGGVTVTPLLVPHRDEYSETVGYLIAGPERTALFIPDIDKWSRWERQLVNVVQEVDYALLDATFFADGELPGRDMSKIPHPLVTESMDILGSLDATQRSKVWFIHFNHTNPLLDLRSEPARRVRAAGFNVASEGVRLPL